MHDSKAVVSQAANDAPIGSVTTIEPLASGYTSTAYKIISSEGDFIALTQKDDGVAPAHYAYHFAILKELEYIQYKFAPRAVYINPEQSVIVMTQVPGEALGWINHAADEQQKQVVETLVTALLDLRETSFARCGETYKQLCGQDLPAVTPQTNVKKYLSDWYKLAQDGQPDSELLSWIEPKVALCEAFVKNIKVTDQIVLSHGDSTEGNILLTPDLNLTLIDWDGSAFSRLAEDQDDYGLAYLMNHVPLFQKFRSLVISLVSERCQVNPDKLEEDILRLQEIIKLCDIQWAIMMNSRVTAGEIDGNPRKFLDIAQQRIAEYQQQFATHSLLQS